MAKDSLEEALKKAGMDLGLETKKISSKKTVVKKHSISSSQKNPLIIFGFLLLILYFIYVFIGG